MGQRHGSVVKSKRISCPPQYGHRDLQGFPRRLGERHVFRKPSVFPLIRSLRASAQPSTSVSFSFVLSFDCGRIIHHINSAMILCGVGLRKRAQKARPQGTRNFLPVYGQITTSPCLYSILISGWPITLLDTAMIFRGIPVLELETISLHKRL
jgi:hypothetical protein